MRAGRLRHRLRIEVSTPTRDDMGGQVQVWSPYAVRWGAVEPLVGRERFAALQAEGQVDHRVTLRYLAGLTPSMRILFGDRRLDVISVLNPEERGISTELLCREAVG